MCIRDLIARSCLACCLLFAAAAALAQPQRVEVKNADQLVIENRESGPVRYLIGNVILAQDTMTMYCDSAVLDPGRNFVEAHRNVRIVTSSRVQVFADRMEYDGQTKIARLFDRIRLEQDSVRLLTDRMEYDRVQRVGRYTEGGRLIDPRNTLTSRIGLYYPDSRTAEFQDSVRLVNERYTLNAARLRYRTDIKTAYFIAATYIKTEDGKDLFTDDGWFDTRLNRTLLYSRPWYRDSSYFLRADTIYYDDSLKQGRARCGVSMHNADSTLQVNADSAAFFGDTREVLLTDHPYLIQRFDADTLLLIADTLYSIDDSANGRQRLRAFGRATVWMRDLQAIADSLEYNRIDSTLHLFKDPVLWSGMNQLSGDTIRLWMQNQTADSLLADGRAMVISRNDSLFDDQVKGRVLKAKFKNEQIARLRVEGNSESMYLVKDNEKRVGLNRSFSQSLRVELKDNEPQTIVFIQEPEATFFPVHEVWGQQNQLDGYKWRVDEKPAGYLGPLPLE